MKPSVYLSAAIHALTRREGKKKKKSAKEEKKEEKTNNVPEKGKKNPTQLPSYVRPPMQTAGASLSFRRLSFWEVNRMAPGAIKQPLHIVSCTRPIFDFFNAEDGESPSLGGAKRSLH